MLAASPVPAIPSVPAPPSVLPFDYVGYVERDGITTVALASNERIFLTKQGENIGADYRLVAVTPPAVMYLPTGARLLVRRRAEVVPASMAGAALAPFLSATPMVVGAERNVAVPEAAEAAEIEAEIARALAVPAPAPVTGSSFPLAR